MTFEVLVFLILVALVFDFMNGFHDAANSIATVVSTGVLKPLWAVGWAAFFNFMAFFIFQTKVATTIGKGIIDPAIIDHYVVFGALVGAIAWNLITWFYGIPSSSSHALIGGVGGGSGSEGRDRFADGERSGKNHRVYRVLSAAGVRAWGPAGDPRFMDMLSDIAESGRQLVSPAATDFCRHVQPGPRR